MAQQTANTSTGGPVASSIPLSKKIEVFIDDKKILVDPGMTILQACSLVGVDIPRFCYHDRLSIAGNCRMCLVEVEKSVKPVASCAMAVTNGMRVKTNSPMTKKAREGVMEFLLVNHPLDCPICDQGGECDLQDQSMAFGSDRSRLGLTFDDKRAVEDKDIGPLIKTIMTRCIHCTRCIRFANEIAGVPDLGTTGRGSDMQVGTYVEKLFASELSGNIIDLCPVGALTSKQYSFVARPWETRKTESIDVMDAIGSNTIISHRTGEILRIIPRINEDVNEEWLGDKARFICDGLKRQRLLQPMLKRSANGLEPCDWEEALYTAAARLRRTPVDDIVGVSGALVDTETLVAFKDLLNRFGCEQVYSEGELPGAGSADLRSAYLFNDRLTAVEDCDTLLIVGTNPRYEAPVFNARIRKTFMYTDIQIGMIGSYVDLTYDYDYLGSTLDSLDELIAGRGNFAQRLQSAQRPLIIVGFRALRGEGGKILFRKLQKLVSQLTGGLTKKAISNRHILNVLHHDAAQVAAFDAGYRPFNEWTAEKRRSTQLLFLVGADDRPIKRTELHQEAFVIYQGSHGDAGAEIADLVLPGATFAEKEAIWVNTEGRSQRGYAAITPPGDARNDWTILRALSEVAGRRLPYDTIAELRTRMAEVSPTFLRFGQVEAPNYLKQVEMLSTGETQMTPASNYSYEVSQTALEHFWLTNAIARASPTMAKCVRASRQYAEHPHLDPLLLKSAHG